MVELVQRISLRATIIRMEIGESIDIPSCTLGYASVRNRASLLGKEISRRYSVHFDKPSQLYQVTRHE